MRKRGLTIAILLVILFMSIIISASLGSANLSIVNSLRILLSRIPILNQFVSIEDMKQTYITIVWNIRLPRILLAGLTGSGLAVVGGAFQGLFRNPLADPHILGVSSGAALGATLAMLSGLTVNWLGLGVIGIFAFIGALITVFLVYHLAKLGTSTSVASMLLTGTAISTMLSAVISLLMTFHRDQIEKVYMWTMGSFSAATWSKVAFEAGIIILCSAVIIIYSKDLNVILTGEDTAKSLGIDIERVKRIIIVMASLLVAACVSVSGIIGFVGLIIPHCIRLVSGPDHGKLLPYSLLGGAIFMIFCDTIARTIASPTEIPVGVITAVFGAPYFITLLYLRRRG
jgi:iron complex transport system permease protein